MSSFSNIRVWLLTITTTIALTVLGVNEILSNNYNDTSNSITPENIKPRTRSISAIVQDKVEKKILKDVEVTIIVSGAPKLKRTGSTGYFDLEIPYDTKKVTIELRKEGYHNESYPFNLMIDQDITEILYMEKIQ